jgi:hypothetical protein
MYERDEQSARQITSAGVLKVITGLWAVITLIQFTVWLLICLIGWRLISPWWLWTLVIGGAAVGGLRVALKLREGR